VFLDDRHWLATAKGLYVSADAGQSWQRAVTTNLESVDYPQQLTAVGGRPSTAFAVLAGFASVTTDWGAHWRVVDLPKVTNDFVGLPGLGGWPG
jgi:photosystem II stability/assembly factor-like uncharacterized protein